MAIIFKMLKDMDLQIGRGQDKTGRECTVGGV